MIAAALLIGGCSHGNIFDLLNRQSSQAAASYCDVMNQQGGAFRWSSKDTRVTKERADKINAAGVRLCGWK